MRLQGSYILRAVVLASAFLLVSVLGFAFFFADTPSYPSATRNHIPAIPVPPVQLGAQATILTLPEPILDIARTEQDVVQIHTVLSVDQTFAFYQQHLLQQGWGPQYHINQQTHQMFIINTQACPYYGLAITITPSTNQQTSVRIDPYLNDLCDD
jgi:hypothetical protein